MSCQTIIGEKLKKLRTDSKITQNQMAQFLNVDQSMIAKLENGQRSFNITMIEKLCNLFGCTEAYLLDKTDDYVPLNFAFRSKSVGADDLESIAAVNKIAMNIKYMNDELGE